MTAQVEDRKHADESWFDADEVRKNYRSSVGYGELWQRAAEGKRRD